MASEGSDYMTNYKTQIRWGLKYIKEDMEPLQKPGSISRTTIGINVKPASVGLTNILDMI